MSKHTPLPWFLHVAEDAGSDDEDYCYVECQEGARIGMEFPDATTLIDPELGFLTEEDAAFVVLACNSHYELLSALKALVERGTDSPEHMAAEAAIAKAEAIS